MCIKYFFAHPPSPGSTFVSSLLSPPSPSPTITYSIFWNLHIFTCLDRLQHPLIKFRFQNHPIRSSPPSTRIFVFRARSAFFCPPRGKGKNKDSKFTEQERKKKQTSKGIILSNNCIIIIIVRAAQLSQLLRSPPDPESRILNQTRSSRSPQLLLRDRD